MRIAVLGAGAIGKVHIRLLNKLGIEEPCFLCRTVESGQATAKYLHKEFGIRSNFYTCFDALVSNGLDGATVCLPTELHYEYLMKLLSSQIPVFCEKPLFWNKLDSRKDVTLKLKEISKFKEKILLVNTCNSCFIKTVKRHESVCEPIESFKFNFFTNGLNRYWDIGIDLLPHALSLLVELLGNCEIKNLKIDQVEYNRFFCSFCYDKAHVEFDLRESQDITKELSFIINGTEYKRLQETLNSNYRVSLKNLENGNQYYMQDPFEVYIQKFLDSCKNKCTSDIEDSLTNFNKMCEIIF